MSYEERLKDLRMFYFEKRFFLGGEEGVSNLTGKPWELKMLFKYLKYILPKDIMACSLPFWNVAERHTETGEKGGGDYFYWGEGEEKLC